jgi:predicted HicB family RNase H-like nuclease
LPEATASKEYSGKFIVRVSPAAHRKTVLKAMARGDSLNQFVAQALAKA